MSLCARLVALVSMLGVGATPGFGCKCSGVHGRTAWETAEIEAARSDAIFEGTPEHLAVQWNILTAKSGEMIRPDPGASWMSGNWPRMLVTFRVKRVYKGNMGATVQVWTGMGGGDCGAHYAIGLDYLVYASGSTPADLRVGICSPGGWLGSNRLAAELRHLRRKRPIPSDLATLEYWTPSAIARLDKEREEYAAATGQICGSISPAASNENEWQQIAFLPTIGYSPSESAVAKVDRDGKFCSDRLGPGEYYLYYTRGRLFGELESALYYPSVVERARAVTVRVEAGQVHSNLIFHIPKQKTYTVRGFLSVDDKRAIGNDGVYAILVGPDGRNWGTQSVDFSGSLPLPKVKYFNLGNVPPGRYIACVIGPGKDWLSRIVEVDVTTHSKLIFLALQHTK